MFIYIIVFFNVILFYIAVAFLLSYKSANRNTPFISDNNLYKLKKTNLEYSRLLDGYQESFESDILKLVENINNKYRTLLIIESISKPSSNTVYSLTKKINYLSNELSRLKDKANKLKAKIHL